MTLVMIAQFEDPYEGEIAAVALRAAGIEPFYNSQGLASANPFMRQAVGGFPLSVLDEDVQQARQILRDARDASAASGLGASAVADDDDEHDDGPTRRRRSRVIAVSCYLGLPLAFISLTVLWMMVAAPR
jgi:hypothetical protein